MKTPNKPLFIIDSSQNHGRGEETQWISCTSSSCPFVAMAIVIDENEYSRHYDPSDVTTIYSESINGERMMAHITNIATGYDQTQVRTLMRKLMKELLTRKSIVEFDPKEPSDEAVLKFIEVIQGQNRENIRKDPGNPIHKDVFALLKKIQMDYLKKIEK